MPNHIQLTFTDLQPEQQELLIAHLAEIGYEGFEEGDTELKAFIAEENYDSSLLKELQYKYQLCFSEQVIPEQNWNAEWESHFPPVAVDDFVAIRADFHQPIPGVEQEIIITPKMSFGTGHHATTYMMIQQMREIAFREKKVFDFGTGTGILAILSEKLGAADITAIDNDEWSIANAKENFEKNNCRRIHLAREDVLAGKEQYDIILANVNKNVILDNLCSLAEHLAPRGNLLLSGLLSEDETDLQLQAGLFSLKMTGKKEKNRWICLCFSH